jgi:CRISPR-associated protein Cas5d
MSQFCLRVGGEFACFTRPEMKVERVSYDVITPSAARAIFEAIFWKPPVAWEITKIEVLKPIQSFNVRRNEVSEVISTGTAKSAMKQGSGKLGLYIEDYRQQRAALILKDVAYRLHARLAIRQELLPEGETVGKYYAMFERRAKNGQVFHRPYLGCREFAAQVAWSTPDDMAKEPPIDESRELGWMLYDLDYTEPLNPKPLFYKPQLERGVIHVPSRHSEEVRG